MKTDFEFNTLRFFNVLKRDIIEERATPIRMAIIGVCIPIFLAFIKYSSPYINFIQANNFLFSVIGLAFILVLAANTGTFINARFITQERKLSYMMTSASYIEKYISALVITLFILPAIFLISLYIGTVIFFWMAELIYSFEILPMNLGMALNGIPGAVSFFIFFCILLHSYFFLGGFFFRKKSYQKSFLVIVIFILISVGLNYIITFRSLDNDTIRVPQETVMSMFLYAKCIMGTLALVNYVLAFKRFKETEFIESKI